MLVICKIRRKYILSLFYTNDEVKIHYKTSKLDKHISGVHADCNKNSELHVVRYTNMKNTYKILNRYIAEKHDAYII